MNRSLIAACALALGACTSMAPKYERPAAPVASNYPTGPAYKDVSGGTPAADLGWRDFLKDARLQRLVEIALANNRDLRVAALNVQQVQAEYRIQRSALLPTVAAFADESASRTPTNSVPVRRQWEAGVQASWELDFFGRLRSLSDAALEQYFASGEARRAAQILLVSQVADQYLALLALDEQLAVTRQTLATAEESYKIVKLQFDTGTAPELSLQQALSVVELAN
ncbi:MAG TPA: TolC family protein, partial [Burkholderiales bacterium]|nr:TolC family protein [Burkholderiales bacterium]